MAVQNQMISIYRDSFSMKRFFKLKDLTNFESDYYFLEHDNIQTGLVSLFSWIGTFKFICPRFGSG